MAVAYVSRPLWLVGNIALLGLIVIVGFAAIIAPSPPSTPLVQLGTWANFPSSVCSASNFTDRCELMGNTSYRKDIFLQGNPAGFQALLSVSCISPSSVAGASIYLQYANSTNGATNTSNWKTLANSQLLVDNSSPTLHPCPGLGVSTGYTALPNFPSTVFVLFRVVGGMGGGSGDSVRFASIDILLQKNLQLSPLFHLVSTSTTNFKFQIVVGQPVSASLTTTIWWIASNVTSDGCGVFGLFTDHCWESGTSSACVIGAGATICSTSTQTFLTAFTGTVRVTASILIPSTTSAVVLASLSVLNVETVSV